MGQMKISEVQQEMLRDAAEELARVQQQNTVILTAFLAADNIRTAQNVRHEGELLVWDDDADEPDIAPDEDVLKEAAEALTAESKASEPQGPEPEGESDGPEVSAPEESGSEVAVEAPAG